MSIQNYLKRGAEEISRELGMPVMHVFVKQVPDTSTLEFDPATLEPRLEKAAMRLGEADLVALEAAVRLKEGFGGEVVVLSAGDKVNELVFREALAIGADRCFYISDPRMANADSLVTANVLARLSMNVGKPDLLLCGEASSDHGNYQLGPRLSEILGFPCITYATSLEMAGNLFRVKRALEDKIEIFECEPPLIVTASLELASPRLPSLLMIRAASRKPINRVEASSLGLVDENFDSGSERIAVKIAKTSRKNIVFSGDVGECATKLIESLTKEGVLGV